MDDQKVSDAMYGNQSDDEDVKVAVKEPVKAAPIPKAKLPDVSIQFKI